MKATYSSNSSIMQVFPEGVTEYIKSKDIIGTYQKDEIPVFGIIMNTKSKYGTSYALAVSVKNTFKYLNIPSWLGKKIFEDFKNEGSDAEAFFTGVSVKSIEEFKTENGTSVSVEFYTE